MNAVYTKIYNRYNYTSRKKKRDSVKDFVSDAKNCHQVAMLIVLVADVLKREVAV